jgi:hypothetical protein
MSHLATWTQNNFIVHDDTDETPHPAHYLKVDKLIDGTWVNTGWAPHIKAVDQHAIAIGGNVRAVNVTDNVIVYEKCHDKLVDIETELCDNACLEHN